MIKKVFFILYMIWGIQHINAQTTAIPDTVFEQRLIDLGIDSDSLVNGQILNSDAAAVTSLDVSYWMIYDLTGIEAFVNLDSLNCHYNNLDSLDVSSNTALTYLSCGSSNLSYLNLGSSSALTYLSCEQSILTSLDLSGCTVLGRLNCELNSLTNLDVSNCPLLWYVACGANNLTNLDFSNNPILSNVYCNNNSLANLDFSNNPSLFQLFCEHNSLSSLNLSQNNNLLSLHCRSNLPYLKICVPNLQAALTSVQTLHYKNDPSAVYLENCNPLAVEGQIIIDDNFNCVVDSLEQGLMGQIVKFERVTDSVIVYSSSFDSLGNYTASLDTGTYQVSYLPSSPYWQVCNGNYQQVVVDTNYNIQTLDWALQPLVSCPFLEVDISAPFLRMTGGGSFYTISYCNNGTLVAPNASVEVDLDIDLNFISSSIPLAGQNGTIYLFNLGAIGVGQCGSFDIQVLVDTSAQNEQTHCTEAHIYPDSICTPIWTGAIVDGSVSCQNDTVFFTLQNTGTAMLLPQPYDIIEDDIAMRIGTIQLGAGQSTTIAHAADSGKTYRIVVSQMPGFPSLLGDSVFSVAIEGCNPFPNGSFNTGFVTMFASAISSPFVALDCQQNVSSFDPNDKSAQPLGYGTEHFIYKNTAIDYKIRFQNTGTDTAFNIVIFDTLSSHLDVSSLQMGASSHSYNWLIENGNVLKVSFLNIMLVDSNANEPLSHGFFRYSIDQKANNPLGTRIENRAAIYFDYNSPIMTNTTWHTIGENFVISTVSIDKIYDKKAKVTVFPNPFSHSTTFKIDGKEYDELQLSVFDVAGRKVAQETGYSNNQIQLPRGNMQAGIYFYQIMGDDKLINVGKIIVQ